MRPMIVICKLAIISLLLVPAPGRADDLRDSLRVCKQIAVASERLVCLDEILASFEDFTPQASTRGKRRISGVVSNIQEMFGRESLERETVETQPRELVGRSVRITTNIDGGYVFTLENGQIWRQLKLDNGRLFLSRGEQQVDVIIKRRSLKSYSLSIGSSKRSIRVKRIK